ncbi:hypothetical protein BGZ83_002006 [Gryganskiella cystojenkinii]|nr:hypothetical protein BGZ83_002006 [Gryganskiella cystojenkinii]
MLRRMTKQSFMDVDLEYLMRLDPTTQDPFENSSPLLSDPPSLFRPLPSVAAAAQAIAQGAAPWTFQEAARLQKEQEDLRVQYLHFLHQLHQTNAHGFLAHMNTFATEFPQEFLQLQSYIRFQEQSAQQQRDEQQKQAELVRYQLELEKRNKQEQDLRRFQQFQEIQEKQQEQQKQHQLLLEWLLRRQQQRASQRREPDRADLFTMAFQRDPQLLGKMVSSPGGMDLLLTPQQQFEFSQFMQVRQTEEDNNRNQDLLGNMAYLSAAAAASDAATSSSSSVSSSSLGHLGSSLLFALNSNSNSNNNNNNNNNNNQSTGNSYSIGNSNLFGNTPLAVPVNNHSGQSGQRRSGRINSQPVMRYV